MKASDLKPGQFFEWDNVRLLAVRPRLNVPAFVAVNIHDNLFNVPSDSEVDAGVPQSWDDEPESDPAPLQLREGGYYLDRLNRTHGPLKPYRPDEEGFAFECGECSYHADGRHCWKECELDLIAEVPPPVDEDDTKRDAERATAKRTVRSVAARDGRKGRW